MATRWRRGYTNCCNQWMISDAFPWSSGKMCPYWGKHDWPVENDGGVKRFGHHVKRGDDSSYTTSTQQKTLHLAWRLESLRHLETQTIVCLDWLVSHGNKHNSRENNQKYLDLRVDEIWSIVLVHGLLQPLWEIVPGWIDPLSFCIVLVGSWKGLHGSISISKAPKAPLIRPKRIWFSFGNLEKRQFGGYTIFVISKMK